jgi:hypothetical protein
VRLRFVCWASADWKAVELIRPTYGLVMMTDINNLKQQTTAMHLYASENGDILPWPNWAAQRRGQKEGVKQ